MNMEKLQALLNDSTYNRVKIRADYGGYWVNLEFGAAYDGPTAVPLRAGPFTTIEEAEKYSACVTKEIVLFGATISLMLLQHTEEEKRNGKASAT